MSKTIQYTRGEIGAAESSTTSASDLVPGGGADQKIGGLAAPCAPAPWQVNRAGIAPLTKTGLRDRHRQRGVGDQRLWLAEQAAAAQQQAACQQARQPPVSPAAAAAISTPAHAASPCPVRLRRRRSRTALHPTPEPAGRHPVRTPATDALPIGLVRLARRPEHDLVPGRHRGAPRPRRSLPSWPPPPAGVRASEPSPPAAAAGSAGCRRGRSVTTARHRRGSAGHGARAIAVRCRGRVICVSLAAAEQRPCARVAAPDRRTGCAAATDRRHRGRRPAALGERDRGPLFLRQAQPDRLIVVRDDMPPPRIVDPLGGA